MSMKLAQRIPYYSWVSDDTFEHLKEFLLKNADLLDEITLFSEFSHHGYNPLERVEAETEILKRRIAEIKRLGYRSVGVNVLDTIGHINEGFTCFESPFRPITGWTGAEAKSCFCPQYPEFREYLRRKYTLYAKTNPDFLWIDDDIKIFWNGVDFGCFCPACLERFNRKNGTYFSREQLVDSMNRPEEISLRRAFVEDVSSKISELLTFIKDTVRAVIPDLPMGFMTQHQGWSTFNGMSFGDWFHAADAARGRPGEGFYDDTVPENLCVKVLSASREVSEYPDSVTDVQYEIENFPYHLFQKSRRVTTDECTLAVASGMNGILLNTLTIEPHRGLAKFDPLYEDIRNLRPVWDKMSEFGADCRSRGFYPAISSDYDKRRPLHNGESFFQTYDGTYNHNVMKTYSLLQMGVPLSMDRRSADGVILTGDLPDGFTDEELRGFLSGAVILDGEAVNALERRGLSRFVGVKAGRSVEDGIMERFSDGDEINEGLAEIYRDARIAFFKGTCLLLERLDERVREVSFVEDYSGRKLGSAVTLFENELGGRVCVMGYSAFSRVGSLSRRIQLLRISRYLTRSGLPSEILSNLKAAQFVRASADGKKTLVAFLNTSLDNTGVVKLRIQNAGRARLLLPGGGSAELEKGTDGQYPVFLLPDTLPFETRVVLAEK